MGPSNTKSMSAKDLGEMEEREKFINKMKEQLIIVNKNTYFEAMRSLETICEYQKTKL